MNFWGVLGLHFSFFFFLLFFPLLFSLCYSSVPAVHLITTVYSTVVRTRECVCVREAGRVTAALTHSIVLFYFFNIFFFSLCVFRVDIF